MEHLLQKSKCSIFHNIFNYMIFERCQKELSWSKGLSTPVAPIRCGFFVCVWSLICDEVLCVIFSFANILLRKRELVALLQLCSCCHVGVCVLSLFLLVTWVDLSLWQFLVILVCFLFNMCFFIVDVFRLNIAFNDFKNETLYIIQILE